MQIIRLAFIRLNTLIGLLVAVQRERRELYFVIALVLIIQSSL
jgi:hypothetical protein